MFRVRRIRGTIAHWETLLLTGGALGAQAPLPQPKPIVVAPLPKPGQAAPRPKPATPDPAVDRAETAKKPAASKPASTETRRGGKAADYGSTPVPWPKGSADPAHFPADIPRVPRAWREAYSLGPQTASAYFLCGDPPAAVIRIYLEFAAREQWELVPIPGPPLPEERIVIARKGDWSLRVDAASHPFSGGTEVFVSASLKPLPAEPKAGKGKP